MNALYFAKSLNGMIPRGSILSKEPTASNQIPIIAKEFEVFTHQGQEYLLSDKQELEYAGTLQTGMGNDYYFQKSNITYRYNQKLEIQEVSPNWLKKGIQTNKGIVIELGDEIAICENGEGKKPYFKKSLLPIESDRELVDQELQALEYRGRLYKSLVGAAPAVKQGAPKWNVSFAGLKAQIVPAQEHTEGEIRRFGLNDTRQLTRAKSGMLRWLSVDEKVKLQEAKQKAQIEEGKGKERKKYEEGTKNKGTFSNLFRIGKEIFVRGEKAKVIDYGNDIVAVKKPDGKTTTIRASEYDQESHEPARSTEPRAANETPEQTANKEMENRKSQKLLEHDLHPETPRNKYYDEQQAIIKNQESLPEYQKFQEEQSKDGWTRDIATPFRFVKDISFVSSLGNLRSGTAEKVWRPEKKDYDYYFEGQGFDVAYQGKQYNIVGMNDGNIDIRDQFGNKQTIKNNDIDQFRGQIILDAEGNARIKNAQGEEFSLELNEGLTQEDLFKPGTVKIIRDEVWKSIKNGEGAVIDDVKLGKIRNGIAFYKHGDEAGIVDENKHQFQVAQKDAKRDQPELSKKLESVKVEVQKARKKLDAKNEQVQDMETVKARVLHGNENVPYAKKVEGLEPEKYKDVFDQWLKDGGADMDEQLAGSYANPDEWKANVLSLAERMRVEDVKRASEVTALNDFAKTGVIIEPPKPREMNEYIETAKDILMSRRKDFLRSKQTEKDENAKFGWDEPAELPNEKEDAIVDDNVKIIRDSKNESYQVQYAFVPKKDIIASHSMTGEANKEHPTELQARERDKDEASNIQMRKIASEPNEELVEDNKDATRGAPVAYSKGGKTYIVQGNGRAGAVQGMEGAGKEKYFGMMLQKAKELGIPTDKVTDDMMLVRVMSPVHTYEDARKLGAFGQKSSALPMTEVEEARSFQNAQRLKFGLNLNLTGIGRRSITEKNVGNFIRNNPQVYQKILKLSGYDPIAVQYRPAEQAKVVNTALLAQLDKDFIRTVSRKGEDTHELVKVTAPIIADNQKDIADGAVPPNGDIQKFLKNSIEQYDSLSSATKNLLKVDKSGNIPFLETGEEGRKNPDSLISRMRQEAIEFGDKKSGNIFRNPLNVIGMIAYNQAMTPRDPDKKDQARELFALKMKRFADAMKTLKEKGEQGADIFAAQLSPEQQTAQQQEDIIKIAERVFLENKPYREENAEEMTAEEKEAGKQTYSAFNAYKKMKDVAKEFEFDLEHHKLRKSLLGYFFKSRIQKYHEEINNQFKKSTPAKSNSTDLRTGYNGLNSSEAPSSSRAAARQSEGQIKLIKENGIINPVRSLFKSLTNKYQSEIKKFKVDQGNLFGVQEEHHVGDKKTENGIEYTLLETTIGKPRWHTQAEIEAMKTEKKPEPKEDKYAKRRERDEAEQKKKPQTLKAMEELSARGFLTGDPEDAVKVLPANYRGALLRKYSDPFETNYKYDSEKQSAQEKFYDYWNEKFRSNIERLMKEAESKPTSHIPFKKLKLEAEKKEEAKPDTGKTKEQEEATAWEDVRKKNGIRKGSYDDHVGFNLYQMKSNRDEWSAVPIKSMTDDGEGHIMPEFDRKGIENFKEAPTIFKSGSDPDSMCCGLCGHKIKMAYPIKNDTKEWYLSVGSECVTNFGESKSGEELIRSKKLELGIALINETSELEKQFWNKYHKGGFSSHNFKLYEAVNKKRIAIKRNLEYKTEEKERDQYVLSIYSNRAELKKNLMRMKAELGIQQVTCEKAEVTSIEKSKWGHDEYAVRYKGDRLYNQPRFMTKGELDNRYTDWESKVTESSIRKSIFRFFKSQMDMFGTPKPKQQSAQLSWKSLGQEKPNHKYKRRERGKGGEWVYYYEDEKGQEFKGDAKGKPLPKHHDWQEGDTVIHDSKKYSLGRFGDNIATIISDKGEVKAVRIAELTHEADHQKNLVKQHEAKWDRLVAALEADLEQGEEKKEYQYADSKLELIRKISYAKEEREQRKGNQSSQNPALESKPQGSGEATIPEFKNTQDAIAFGDKATPEQAEELKRLQGEIKIEFRKLMNEKKNQEALDVAVKGQFYREALEAYEKEPGSSVSTSRLREKSPGTESGSVKSEPVSSGTGEAGSTPKDQTSTPEFKKWFGDSKVVDKDGKPKVVYHGTPTGGFTEFSETGKRDSGWAGKAIYFTESKSTAENFTARRLNDKEKGKKQVYETYLTAKNPLEISDVPILPEEKIRKALNEERSKNGKGEIEDSRWKGYWQGWQEELSKAKDNDILISKAFNEYFGDISKYAKNMGYDSIHGKMEGGTWAIFNPSQIKSAIGNKGTFDPETADITKSIFSNAREWFKQLIQARKDTDTNPTEAEKKAGNYAKGKVSLYGLTISIENPKGSIRRGKDHNGTPWECKLKHDYGYINGTTGKDKDHLDVFLGDDKDAKNVYIVNQVFPDTKKFDEHKILMLMSNKKEATEAYKSNYSDDADKRIDSMAEMTIEEFKKWIESGNHKVKAEEPASEEPLMKSIEAKKPEPPKIQNTEIVKEIVQQVLAEQKENANETKNEIISEIKKIEEEKKQSVPTKWVFKIQRNLEGLIQEITAEKK